MTTDQQVLIHLATNMYLLSPQTAQLCRKAFSNYGNFNLKDGAWRDRMVGVAGGWA